ncbi:MAG: UDP-2,3-diacylglucosamine diphosphatase [Gammaproteobacteria bacterium]|nr:UDP-2,3-diacylglucosamine diphosphatase [Gammaproteobacteria bacterium]MDH3466216.1 UDP-2,3-diacylglucosamine diphosphatase [Gammaproteobacteria bacterium]
MAHTLFISDLHLTPERPQILELFLQFLDHDARNAEALYILGDLFEYWIGDDAAEQLGHQSILHGLRRLTDSGIPVYVMHGNRDFLIGSDFCRQTSTTLLPDPTTLMLYGRAIVILHGDSLCTDDTEHQRFRAAVREQTWQDEFLAKPIRARLAIAKQLRQQSDRNKQTKNPVIMDVNEQSVRDVMKIHGVNVLIHGHTHRPGFHTLNSGRQRTQRIVLGDWYEQSSVLTVSPDGFELTPSAGATRA